MSADEVDVKAIENRVIEIISEQMGVDKSEITRETSFINDLNSGERSSSPVECSSRRNFSMRRLTLFRRSLSRSAVLLYSSRVEKIWIILSTLMYLPLYAMSGLERIS